MNEVNWHLSYLPRARILIVDDRQDNIFALKKILGDMKTLHIDVAYSGEEALYKTIENQYALVILDVQMPKMDGFTVAKYLREYEPTKDLPVIFVTAINKDSDHIRLGYKLGAVDYLFKPVNPIVLRSKVNVFISLHNAAQRSEKNRKDVEQILNSLAESIIGIDVNYNIHYVNRAGLQILGISNIDPQKNVFDSLQLFSHDTQINITDTLLSRLKEKHSIEIPEVVDIINAKGDMYTIEFDVHQVFDYEQVLRGMIFTMRDITISCQLSEKLQYQALNDLLTRLPNRIFFTERLKAAIAAGKREKQNHALLFFDLDGFKKINDTLGHEYGDEMLKEIAQRLTNIARKTDCVARFGGDEFVLLMHNIKSTSITAQMAQRVIEEINKPFLILNQELFLGASVGISIFPANGSDAETLLKHADAAMYLAKEKGKNNYQFYEESLQTKAEKHLFILNDLRRGLDKGEFEVYLQPQVDCFEQSIIGLEALIRWNHPLKGFIPPLDFITLAEENGLISLLDEFVFRRVCEYKSEWKKRGLNNYRIAINLSALHLNFPNFADNLVAITQQYQIAPSQLELEVTESIFIGENLPMLDVLFSLKDKGFRIALDDFGTGYSSLSYLTKLPIDVLKIDQTFVRNIKVSKRDITIIEAIIELSNHLDIELLIEGVETEEQCVFLLERGCHCFQGYYFAKPMNHKDANILMENPNTILNKLKPFDNKKKHGT